MLVAVYVGQIRRACLPVINGTEVGSSGVSIQVMQASDVLYVFIVVRVCHLIILSLFPIALLK